MNKYNSINNNILHNYIIIVLGFVIIVIIIRITLTTINIITLMTNISIQEFAYYLTLCKQCVQIYFDLQQLA